ncbi:MAG: CDGSH iron-sulfur domain-containing protein [Arenimonas sp.]
MASDIQDYQGKDLVVHFDGKRCIHSRNCILGLPDVFIGNAKGPWIHPDAANAEEVAAIVRNCPSGALTYQRKDIGLEEEAATKNTARILENGPYVFRGDLQIAGQAPRTRATLCRCGATKAAPFCDGSHYKIGFTATGEPTPVAIPDEALHRGPLVITPISNGALVIDGPLDIVSGTGSQIAKEGKAELCRCGASGNKPYCDGSHESAVFRDK